jgi:hypothetical protein
MLLGAPSMCSGTCAHVCACILVFVSKGRVSRQQKYSRKSKLHVQRPGGRKEPRLFEEE